MRRILTLIGVLAVMSALTWAAAAATAPGPRSAAFLGVLAERSELDRIIDLLESRPAGDLANEMALGHRYYERAILTGDLDDHLRARAAYERALAQAPDHRPAILGAARTAAARHDFDRALALAERALALDATDTDAWVILGDARLELGDIDGAEAAFAAAPAGDPAMTARAAGLAHLRGDQDAAIELAADARAAAQRAGATGRALAFYLLLEGDLRTDAGDYGSALALADEAVGLDESWAPTHAARADALTALGRYEDAGTAYRRALRLQPGDPGWLAALGDLATLAGDPAAARWALAAERSAERHDEAIYGRFLASAWADGGVRLDDALRIAEAEVASRGDIGAYDLYAWVLYRSGRIDEAASAIERATALGTADGELRFHQAMITAATGDTETAATVVGELIDTNPAFHPVHRWTAAALADRLES